MFRRITFGIALLPFIALGEFSPPPAGVPMGYANAPAAPVAPVAQEVVETTLTPQDIEKFSKKVLGDDQKPLKAVFLTSFDYTKRNVKSTVESAMRGRFKKFGKVEIENNPQVLTALNLEEFRLASIRSQALILIQLILKPTDFEVFLYDRRNPYGIYTHAEILPDGRFHNFEKFVVETVSKNMADNLIRLYLQDQYYELPRADREPVLKTALPRRIASAKNLRLANQDIISTWYLGGSFGTAMTSGVEGQMFSSNIVSLHGGVKVGKYWWVEGSVDTFTYNAAALSMKYFSESKESPFRVMLGLGLAATTSLFTLGWDQSNDIGYRPFYFMPSVSAVMFPVGRVYIRAEARAYVSFDFKRVIFTAMPGLLIRF